MLFGAAQAQSAGLRQAAGTDMGWWVQGHPNVVYERRLSDHFSWGAGVGIDFTQDNEGLLLTPSVRFYRTGALRSGYILQVGSRLHSNEPILGELGVGHAFWIDRVHATPVAKIRHDLSWQVEVNLGVGWY
ncbi:hypothetical protein NFC81_00375 [Salinispirillum sp. LH 10-3-1]|uniref:Acyloxyacyl hydrolase n=1 Tax=Salinispirillum sp. LH 10-3-1 TaxID=2952525 RepID=A0AB38YFU6_9GAMM